MNVFRLMATLGLDKSSYESGLNEALGSANGFASKLENGLSTAAKVTGAAIGAASLAIGKLTKDAVTSYSDYEQLIGGVETLFGTGGKSLEQYAQDAGKTVSEIADEYNRLENAQTTVLNNATKAFETAGMSQNQYIDTVTSFSASLIQSLGGDTAKAAQYADMAIIDMADNSNKLGTSIESIQYAYQGFAKQNYTINPLSAV